MTVDEDMHLIGFDLFEQLHVVRDDHDAHEGILVTYRSHAARHDAKRVDVQTRIGLIQKGDRRFEQRHLQDFVAFAFASGEAFVQVAFGERRVHSQTVHPFGQVEADLEDAQLLEPLARGDGLAQELDHRHAADGLRVLKGQ